MLRFLFIIWHIILIDMKVIVDNFNFRKRFWDQTLSNGSIFPMQSSTYVLALSVSIPLINSTESELNKDPWKKDKAQVEFDWVIFLKIFSYIL